MIAINGGDATGIAEVAEAFIVAFPDIEVFDLKAESTLDGGWEVVLESIYGIGGSFRCRSIEPLTGEFVRRTS